MIKCHWVNWTSPCTLQATNFSRINDDYYAECDECYENSTLGQVRITEKQYIIGRTEELLND